MIVDLEIGGMLMNYYWWRSNGESGDSGHVYAKHVSDVEKKVYKVFKERDIFVVQLAKNVKSKDMSILALK